jgi:kynurenine 3-monooxygenase
MFIALPNFDGSFTCTLFAPHEAGPGCFGHIHTEEEAKAYMLEHFPDVVPMIPTIGKDFINNPTSSLVMIKAYPLAL